MSRSSTKDPALRLVCVADDHAVHRCNAIPAVVSTRCSQFLSSRTAHQTVGLGQEIEGNGVVEAVEQAAPSPCSVFDGYAMTEVLLQVALGQASDGSLLSLVPTEILVPPMLSATEPPLCRPDD